MNHFHPKKGALNEGLGQQINSRYLFSFCSSLEKGTKTKNNKNNKRKDFEPHLGQEKGKGLELEGGWGGGREKPRENLFLEVGKT